MRTFLVFNEITAEIINELRGIELVGTVSIHTPSDLDKVISNMKDGDTLIIEGIHLFNGVSELHSALSFISNLSNGNFISLKQKLLKIDNGHINKDILEVIAIGAGLEEKCSNMAKSSSDIESMKRLCIRILEDSFKKSKNI